MEAVRRHPARRMTAAAHVVAALLALVVAAGTAAAQEVDQSGLYRDPFLVLDAGMHTASIKAMDVDPTGRFLVTGSSDKTVRLWSARDGSLLSTIHLPSGPGELGEVDAVALSPDGRTVAAGGWTGEPAGRDRLYLFDRETGREVGRRADVDDVVLGLAFSPDGRRLAASLGDTHGVRLFASPSLAPLASDGHYGDSSYGVAFARDGRIATTSLDGKLRLYDPLLKLLRPPMPAPDGMQPFGIAFSPDGSRLAIGSARTTRVSLLDSSTLRATATQPASAAVKTGDLSVVAWSLDGTALYAGGTLQQSRTTFIRAWSDVGSGIARDYPYPAENNRITALRPLPGEQIAVARGDPGVLVMDSSGHPVWQKDPVTADFRGVGNNFRVGAQGTLVEFDLGGSWRERVRFNLRKLQYEPASDRSPPLQPPHTSGLDIQHWHESLAPTFAGQNIAIEPFETSESVAVAPDANGFVLGTNFYVRGFDGDGTRLWSVPAHDVAWAVNVSQDGRLALAAFGDGTIRWYGMDDGAELLAFFPHKDGKRWVAWTPLGYYAASPGAEDLIKWQINREPDHAPEVFSASRFRDKFYRPDVIKQVLDDLDPQQALQTADQAAARRTVQQPVAAIVDEAPPRVAIIDPAAGTQVDGNALDVAYVIEDRPGTIIRRVRLLQGGLLAAEDHDLTIPKSGRLGATLHMGMQGENPTLTLFAASDKGESDLASVQVRHHAAAPDADKPVLYVVAVGVAQFTNNDGLNLRYAADDAHAVAERLRRQKGTLYRDVQVEELESPARNSGDPVATKDNIMRALQWLERKVTRKDVAVLFVSTHGENDGNGDYYLLPSDADVHDDIALVDSSVQGPDLVRRVRRMAEHGKILVFLDACYSGNIFKAARLDIDKFAQALGSAQSGAIVFTSSSGTEFSGEPDNLAHGILTQAFIEALEGRSSVTNGLLNVDDLRDWFEKEVVNLSNGSQHPKTYTPGPLFTNPTVFVANAAP
jgi:WD40 repeat protein